MACGSVDVQHASAGAGWLARLLPEAIPVDGGVAAPEPFEAAGVHAGIKRHRLDLALIHSPARCAAAGAFTTNRVQAAPVVLTREHLRRTGGQARAVVVNSGNANACTGRRGLDDARAMAEETAAALRARPEEVLVASTGVIGVPLPMDRVLEGIRKAASALSRAGAGQAAEAILTTDTRVKALALALEVGPHGRTIRIGGMAKGSGMIHPRMATMLAFLTTDAPVPPAALQLAVSRAVERSFNMVSVDGDTSTNDMVLALASGAAGGPGIEAGSRPFELFQAGVEAVSTYLAREIARDGEGARRLIEVQVAGARSDEDARLAARAIAGSNLVKTAVAGADPNWGRIAAAVGYSGASLDPDRLAIWLGEVQVVEGGMATSYDEAEARQALSAPEVILRVDLGEGGPGQAVAWTCDLTAEYVRINASYRS